MRRFAKLTISRVLCSADSDSHPGISDENNLTGAAVWTKIPKNHPHVLEKKLYSLQLDKQLRTAWRLVPAWIDPEAEMEEGGMRDMTLDEINRLVAE